MRPGPVMSAGMMPALDLPGRGDARAVRADDAGRVALRAGVRPEVGGVVNRYPLGDHDDERYLGVDRLDHRAPWCTAGGTKTTEVSAPVAAMVSATVPNTGTCRAARRQWSAGLAGVGPADHGGARRPPSGAACLMPSEPVMPWIRISSSRRSGRSPSHAPVAGAAARCPLGRQLRRAARRRRPSCPPARPRRAPPRRGSGAPAPALLPSSRTTIGWVTCSPRPVSMPIADDDAVGDLVARGDAAEHVDEHAADRRVRQHDLQAVRHHLGRGAAADVEEVRRLDAAERLPGQATTSSVDMTSPAPLPMIPTSPSSLT